MIKHFCRLNRLLPVVVVGFAVCTSGCRSVLQGTPFEPRPDSNTARMAYTVQQSERDIGRLKARVETVERQTERLEARIIAMEGQSREVVRLREELRQYREDLKQMRVEIPQNMSTTIKGMLDDQQAQTLSQVQRVVAASQTATATKQSGYNHTVASGQTLSLIAREYKTTVEAIRKANNLKGDQIRVGSVLFIPAD